MLKPTEVYIPAAPIERFAGHVSEAVWRALREAASRFRERLEGRTVWNVNSTPRGGGVAEMLQSLLAYTRGGGVDARWMVVEGTPDFFRITKRLHHALHGSPGDGSPLGRAEHALYDEVLRDNAEELLGLVRPGDLVLLHDPQTAGLAPVLAAAGARVAWRCHVGRDTSNAEVERAWAFLLPSLAAARFTIFSRRAYVPDALASRSAIIQPSIDIFAVKNQPLAPENARAILAHAGLLEGAGDGAAATYVRSDGVATRVVRQADIVRLGRASAPDTPLVVQVSRWDPLKDPVGVMRGFALLTREAPGLKAELVLAGPSVTSVADDPEAAATFEAVLAAWRRLPRHERQRIHLACLPMADVEENAALVNALQRHARVVVQKSLQEGFGLTVTEAMWKGRPVVASAVGGIQDQVVHGEHGLLVDDPQDLPAFAAALRSLLEAPALAERLGHQAHAHVLARFTGARHLTDMARLLERLDTSEVSVHPETHASASPP